MMRLPALDRKTQARIGLKPLKISDQNGLFNFDLNLQTKDER